MEGRRRLMEVWEGDGEKDGETMEERRKMWREVERKRYPSSKRTHILTFCHVSGKQSHRFCPMQEVPRPLGPKG